jgi:lipoprotein-anchoring transpeptidase ErfK/SrfK
VEVRTVAKWLGAVALLAAALAAGCATGHVAHQATNDGAKAAANSPVADSTLHSGPGAPGTSRQAPESPAAAPAPNRCAHNHARRLVLVSITAQHAWLCARSRTVYSTAVTTGMSGADTRTPTGKYTIEGRNKNSVLTLSNGDQYDVKYWIPFDAPLFGFHDSSWQHFPYGSAKYKTDGSHGCVHMPLAAMKFLYDWARIGTNVDIRA